MNTPIAYLPDHVEPSDGFAQALPPLACPHGQHDPPKTNILLVTSGDNPEHEAIVEAVAKSGCQLWQASNSRQAFEALRSDSRQIDAVVVDLDRGIDSFALFEAIRDCVDAPPVIALTAMETFSLAPPSVRRSVVRCLSKPFSTAKLARLIEDVRTLSQRLVQTSDRWGHLQPRRTASICVQPI